jgi:heat shock protein HslJ
MPTMTLHRRPALLACLLLAAPAARAVDMPGPAGSWVAEAIGGETLPSSPRPDITFADDSRAHGNSGCNRYTGGFIRDGASLRFGPVAGTRMACEPPAMAVEQRFHQALEVVRAWRMDGATLLLTDAAGATVVRLVRSRS